MNSFDQQLVNDLAHKKYPRYAIVHQFTGDRKVLTVLRYSPLFNCRYMGVINHSQEKLFFLDNMIDVKGFWKLTTEKV